MSRDLAVVCLVGATGTGKTAAALALAQDLGGGVINFDSRQVYAGLPIVTAQPTPAEQSLCPHALYGYVPLSMPVRAGAFAVEILEQAKAFKARGLVPILVGGTGLYLKSLVEGLAPIPDIDPAVRQKVAAECRAEGSPALYDRLKHLDPQYAARIHPNDPQRVCRALEVFAATSRTLSWWHRQPALTAGPRVLEIGLRADLATLTPRLARRIDVMLEAGALEEVRQAYSTVSDRNAPGFSGIGCPELLSVLLDGQTLIQAKEDWLRSTRAYAKRQLTWFRKDRRIVWHEPGEIVAMLAEARAFLGA
ncbi:MAG: tRNA (adenosine(37)-N6)-dimethylallyltransferase MiaA [Desulfovibrionales bacterium]|nr:tRNA (adenosine(37)-N6)-dimethylallyltransferase MiaA [Desulfovibrionales bacterium]